MNAVLYIIVLIIAFYMRSLAGFLPLLILDMLSVSPKRITTALNLASLIGGILDGVFYMGIIILSLGVFKLSLTPIFLLIAIGLVVYQDIIRCRVELLRPSSHHGIRIPKSEKYTSIGEVITIMILFLYFLKL